MKLLIRTCLTAWLFVCPALTGSAAQAQDDLKVSEQPLHVLSSAVWPTGTIPVCWESSADGFSTEKGWVRDAVARTWEAYALVTFQGWRRCRAGDTQGIRISVSDRPGDNPHTRGLGTNLRGAANGMELNFTFRNWSPSCAAASRREGCVKSLAVHEFGHALGFAHEQNRPDTPDTCTEPTQGTSGDVSIGQWDLMSTMNYCNPRWNNGGVLSPGDIQGLREMYRKPFEAFRFVEGRRQQPGRGWSGYTTLLLDVDRDGDDDLVWNSRGRVNRTYVGLSNGDGTFDLSPAFQDHPNRGWSGYRVLGGDVDGDGDDDLVFNKIGPTNRVYVLESVGHRRQASQTRAFFDMSRRHQDFFGGWNGYETHLADVDGDGAMDMVWNKKGNENHVHVALSTGERFNLEPGGPQVHPNRGWSGYQTLVGDMDGDGDDDLVWARTGDHNRVYVAWSRGDGTFHMPSSSFDHPNFRGGWNDYVPLIGNIDARGPDDIVWNQTQRINRTYTAISNPTASSDGNRRLRYEREQDRHPEIAGRVRVSGSSIWSLFSDEPTPPPWSGYRAFLGDVNGDKRADLVWNHPGRVNRTYVGLARPDLPGVFRFPAPQDHPRSGFGGYETLTGDINGDGLMDLIWNRKSNHNHFYTALAIRRVVTIPTP